MSLYSTELTEADEKAGFALKENLNPQSQYFGASDTVQAVVLDLGDSHRMVKLNRPDGVSTYKLQQFGKDLFQREGEKPEWKPVDDGDFDDPVVAAAHAQQFMTRTDIKFNLHRALGDVR
jgi:hypothetical protein